jgi:hypothetical protein
MTCSHEKCPNDPKWRPHLLSRSRSTDRPTKISFLQLGYCEEHRGTYTIENLLSSEGHTKLGKFMREKGLPEPQQKLAVLGWKLLTADDLEDLKDNQQFTSTGEDELAF